MTTLPVTVLTFVKSRTVKSAIMIYGISAINALTDITLIINATLRAFASNAPLTTVRHAKPGRNANSACLDSLLM